MGVSSRGEGLKCGGGSELPSSNEARSDTGSSSIVIPIVAGVLAACAITVGGVLVWRRCYKGNRGSPKSDNRKSSRASSTRSVDSADSDYGDANDL